jgi:capsular exopolysaccharide synthesis family protein
MDGLIGRITLEELGLRQLWSMLRKRWIIVLALPLLAALTIGAISLFVITPVYEASTTLIVGRKASETALASTVQVAGNSVLQQMIKNYSEIAKSQTVEKNVIKNLNLPMTAVELDKLITVEQVKTTDLIEIKATNTDPVLAASIANTTAQEFSKVVLVDTINIVDLADIPSKPTTPNKTRNVALAFIAGLIAAISLVFMLEYLDNTVKTSSDVKNSLGIPVLGLIANYKMGKQGKSASDHSLITLEETKSPISESYRSIRTNLEFVSLDLVSRKILITSSGPHEGKSFTVANLAVSIAQSGKSVLVLDADMRDPTQHKLFGLDNSHGLSGFLVQDQDYRDYIRETIVPGLMVLTGGPIPPNPAELVGSQGMKRLIEEAGEQFDMVIIDTPPVIEVTDAAILAQKVDGVILILASGDVDKDDVKTAKEHLDNVGAKILGAVLNKVT